MEVLVEQMATPLLPAVKEDNNNDRKKSASSITKEDNDEVANNKFIQYHEELEQAARNSIQGNVGAYSVIPGSLPSRRVVGDYIMMLLLVALELERGAALLKGKGLLIIVL